MSDKTKAIDYFSKKVKKLKENLEKGLYYGEQYQVREDIKHLETVLNLIEKQQAEIEKQDRQLQEVKEFLKREQLELHDFDDNNDLSYEGKGRMYLVDELLKQYFEG